MEMKVRSRSLLVGLVFTLFFLAIIGKLYYIQVVEGAKLQEKAKVIWQEDEVIPARRGTIVERNGKILAEQAKAYTITVNPTVINQKGLAEDVARGLAEALAKTQDSAVIAELERKIYGMATRKRPNSDLYAIEVEVRNEGYLVDSETKQKVENVIESLRKKIEERNAQSDTKLDTKNVGIGIKEAERRVYPFNRLASHVLGYIDVDGKPNYGIESYYNDYLEGTPGHLRTERDLKGVEIPNGKMSYTPPEDGHTVKLTLDYSIQFYLENALRKAYQEWQPKSMTAIVADPKTLEILAMASLPDFNPNEYWKVDNVSVFNNIAISYPYEPGSTFKVVTLAGAVEEGLYNSTETYMSGSYRVPGKTIYDHNISGWGEITYFEGLLRSSNVAFVKLGEKLGPEKLREYIDRFGFGQPTNIDLPQEATGVIPMRYPVEYATATYGQGLSVTAIQQLAAYAAIANGGNLMRPYIVKEIVDPDTGEVVFANEPKVVRRVISEDTALQVALDLEQVVANQEIGTARRAYIEGYRIAAKTGTAQIILPGEKTYADNQWLVTFAGFAPVDDPQLVMVVMAELPDLNGNYHLASEVTAPVFKEVMAQGLSYLGIKTKDPVSVLSFKQSVTTVPDIEGMSLADAKSTLLQHGLQAEVIGEGETVRKQLPVPGSSIADTQRVYLMTEEALEADIPDLTGKSLRDALEICTLLDIKCKAIGEGYVANQSLSGQAEARELTLELVPPEVLATPEKDER